MRKFLFGGGLHLENYSSLLLVHEGQNSMPRVKCPKFQKRDGQNYSFLQHIFRKKLIHGKWQTFWDFNENLNLWKANSVTSIYKFIKRLCFIVIFFFMTFCIKNEKLKQTSRYFILKVKFTVLKLFSFHCLYFMSYIIIKISPKQSLSIILGGNS